MIESCLFTVSPLISNHAVLQRDNIITVQGNGRAHTNVTGELELENGKCSIICRQTIVGKDNSWILEFPPLCAGGPYRFSFSSDETIFCFSDIYIGDVWLLCGQSNMQLPMERVKYRFPEEYNNGSNAVMRQFTVPIGWDFKEEKKTLEDGMWESASTDSFSHFSATGFFFGQAVFAYYQIPIGLILTAVGGTPIQAWMSKRALLSFPKELALADLCKETNYVDNIRSADTKRIDSWWKQLNERDTGIKEQWKKTADVWGKTGRTMCLHDCWENNQELVGAGSIWLKKWIKIPPEQAGKPVRLSLGTITDADFVFINGKQIGSTGYKYPPREYELSGLPEGRNLIVIRIVMMGENGGFTPGKTHRLIFQNQAYIQDISDGWEYQRGATIEPLEEPVFFERKPLGMYQKMIAPLHSFSIKGICWYQGEMNADQSEAYPGYFKEIVRVWREKWNNPSLPVLFVQLPCYGLPDSTNWVAFRAMQQGLTAIPNTAMVVTIDCGEWNDLHPTDKKTVGERLAMAAYRLAYKEWGAWLSPLFIYGERKGTDVFLHFKYAEEGLCTRDNKMILGLELYYEHAGEVELVELGECASISGNMIVVPLVQKDGQYPLSISYAWSNYPKQANLCNRYGLPVAPFLYQVQM